MQTLPVGNVLMSLKISILFGKPVVNDVHLHQEPRGHIIERIQTYTTQKYHDITTHLVCFASKTH